MLKTFIIKVVAIAAVIVSPHELYGVIIHCSMILDVCWQTDRYWVQIGQSSRFLPFWDLRMPQLVIFLAIVLLSVDIFSGIRLETLRSIPTVFFNLWVMTIFDFSCLKLTMVMLLNLLSFIKRVHMRFETIEFISEISVLTLQVLDRLCQIDNQFVCKQVEASVVTLLFIGVRVFLFLTLLHTVKLD